MFCKSCGKELGKNSKFCEGCGTAVVEQVAQTAVTAHLQIESDVQAVPTQQPATASGKKKRTKFKDLSKKKKIARIAVASVFFIIAFILTIGDGLEGANYGSSLTTPADNDTGAVFNMSLDDFSKRFDEAADTPDFSIVDYWDNKIEPQVGYEDDSGKKYTLHCAYIDYSANSPVTVYGKILDGKIASVNCVFEYDADIGLLLAWRVSQALGEMTTDEAADITETVLTGSATTDKKTYVYKDGILYGFVDVSDDEVSWVVLPASEEFVSLFVNSYNCNIVRK